MNNDQPIERVPEADIICFTFCLNFTREQLQDTIDFEGCLDRALAQLFAEVRAEIMQKHRDYQPAPSFFPREE